MLTVCRRSLRYSRIVPSVLTQDPSRRVPTGFEGDYSRLLETSMNYVSLLLIHGELGVMRRIVCLLTFLVAASRRQVFLI